MQVEIPKTKVIDEIKEITATNVAKKQDAAKLNFPKIVEKIKSAALLGNSSVNLATSEMNEYDKELLTMEGFRVSLIDRPKSRHDYMAQYKPEDPEDDDKVWQISW